jgi:hypothetical protein
VIGTDDFSVRSTMAGAGRSLARPHDASRRHASKLLRALKFTGECVSIRAGGAAFDAPVKIVAGMARGAFPRSVIGHRTFDGKEALVMVRDDEEEPPGPLGLRRGLVSHDSEGRHGHADVLLNNEPATGGMIEVVIELTIPSLITAARSPRRLVMEAISSRRRMVARLRGHIKSKDHG